MAQRRYTSTDDLNDCVLIVEGCPPEVRALLLFLDEQGDLSLYQVEPRWAPVFLAELDGYSAAASGPDHGE